MPEIEVPNPHEIHEKAEDPFAKRIALCVAIYAVILAISAAGGNNAGKDMLMEQQKASNKWAQYQAKSIREALYQNDLERMEIDIERVDLTPEARTKISKALERIKKKLEEYKKDKETITEEARKHEAARDRSHMSDPYFDFAEVLMQIGIVMASVAMLSGKRWPFIVSMLLAAMGLALMLNGFFMFDHGKLLGGGSH